MGTVLWFNLQGMWCSCWEEEKLKTTVPPKKDKHRQYNRMLKKLVKGSGYILQQVFLNCNWIDLLGTIQPSHKKCVVLMCLCLH